MDLIQSTREATEDCQVRLDAVQDNWQTAQSELAKMITGSAETVAQGIGQELDTVRTALEHHGAFLSAQRTAEQEAQAKLLKELDVLRETMVQVQQKLDAVAASSAALQDNMQASSAQTAAVLERHSELLVAQRTAEQEARTELLNELKNSREALIQIQQKQDTAIASFAAFQKNIRTNSAQTTEELVRLGKEVSEQLMLLDESSRLLLLHTVMNELDAR